MNRRNFLSLLSAGVAGIALEQAIPLGRVWSFPKEIVIPKAKPIKIPDEVICGFYREPAELGMNVGDIISIAPYPQKFRITAVYESGFSLVTAI